MVRIGEKSPLSISEEAQKQIETLRNAANHPKNAFLRVKAHIPVMGDSISFNMHFDLASQPSDMLYHEGTTALVLDNATAMHLVGSSLVIMPSGELAFKHLETSTCFDTGEKPIYN